MEIGSIESESDARAFSALNEEWISRIFGIEAADRVVLDDPVGAIVATGGDVLIARLDGVAIGCVALIAAGDGSFELSKMAVAPTAQGRGVGRKLMLAAIERARELGAGSLFLGSNNRLANAVHLYESVGFVHVSPETIGHLPYDRADVYMQLVL
jgi:GNAT superfamily N-acetyltransferase